MAKDNKAANVKTAAVKKANTVTTVSTNEPTMTAQSKAATPTNDDEKASAAVRTNVHLKWKNRTLSSLRHLATKYPEIHKSAMEIVAVVEKLPEDSAPTEKSTALKVGDIVRLPEMDEFCTAMKLPNRFEVVEDSRGAAKVKNAKANQYVFTVLSRTADIISRGQGGVD